MRIQRILCRFSSARTAAAHVGHIEVDQNRILADQLNIAPTDDDVLAPAQEAEQTPAAIYDQRIDARAGKIDFKIANAADAAAVFDVYNILAAQIVRTAKHANSPLDANIPLKSGASALLDTVYGGTKIDYAQGLNKQRDMILPSDARIKLVKACYAMRRFSVHCYS